MMAFRRTLTWRLLLLTSFFAFLLPSALFLFISDQVILTYASDSCFLIYTVIAFLAFSRAAYHTRTVQPTLFISWLLMAIACFTIVLSVCVWIFVEIILRERSNALTGASFLLISHFLFGWGVYRFPRNHQSKLQNARQRIELLTVLIGCTLLLWVLWINPLLVHADVDRNTVFVMALYLLSDLVLIAALVSLLFRSQLCQPRGPLLLLSGSIFAMLLADLVFSLQADAYTYHAGGLADHFYLVAVILGAAAATLHSGKIRRPLAQVPPNKQGDRLLGGIRIALPPLLLLLTYLVMVFTHDSGSAFDAKVMAVGIAAMFILVSVHQVLTLLENVDLTFALRSELQDRRQVQGELQQSNILLEQHVAERTKELVVLNDQLRENERQLRFDAFHDKLTGLPNRAAFIHHLESALHAYRSDPTYRFAVLFLDFDGFKVVNDSLGHWLGDEFLIALARRLKEHIPIGNLAARLGGDEFVLLIENILEEEEVLEIADHLQRELRQPFEIRGYRLYTTASIGIVMNDKIHQTAGDLLRDADIAMYRAKENGKACCIVFDGTMRARAMARLKLETALRNALTRQELTLAYQPIWDVAAQCITGFEALARWHNTEQGTVSPAEFIPIAEETGLIIPLGEWVLEEACRQLKCWQERWPQAELLTISVNISAHQLYQGDLVAMVARTLQRTGLSAGSLKLEITESIFMEDIEAAITTCAQLQELGVCLQIDDFGTGYSSFNYLHRLPINTLKIDKSFVDLLDLGGQHIEIVRTIAMLAHNLQLSVIAEGVETQEQLAYIEALGCEQIQGYFISKPLERSRAEQFIHTSLIDNPPSPLQVSTISHRNALAKSAAPVAVAASIV